MDEIKKWAVNLTVILLAGAVLKFIMPSGGASKSAKTVLSLTVLAVMLSFSFSTEGMRFDFPDFGFADAVYENDPYTQAVEKAITEKLDSKGIEYDYIKVNGSMGDDGVYVIESVEISAEPDNLQIILTTLETEFGIERGAFYINEIQY